MIGKHGSYWFYSFILFVSVFKIAHAADPGSDLAVRQRREKADLSDQFETRLRLLSQQYEDAYRKYLRGSQSFPSKLSARFQELSLDRDREFKLIDLKHLAEREGLRLARTRELRPAGVRLAAGGAGPDMEQLGRLMEQFAAGEMPQAGGEGVEIDPTTIPTTIEFAGKPKAEAPQAPTAQSAAGRQPAAQK